MIKPTLISVNFSLCCSILECAHVWALKFSIFAQAYALHAIFASNIHNRAMAESILKLSNEDAAICRKYFNCSSICEAHIVYLTLYITSILKLRPFSKWLIFSRFCVSIWQGIESKRLDLLFQSGHNLWCRMLKHHICKAFKELLFLAKALILAHLTCSI